MQPVEEFMRQYFEERAAEEKREQASRAPFRRKFHTADCYWDSRAGTLEMIQTEKVLRFVVSDTTAQVVTTRHSPSREISVHQLRYHLRGVQDGWLIETVDVWCHSCQGKPGKDDCFLCHGSGWHDGSRPKTKLPPRDTSPPERS